MLLNLRNAHLVGRIGPVDSNHIVILARLAIPDKVLSGPAGEFLRTG